MPLVPGSSKKAIRENIEIEMKIGKRPRKQAVAIALNEAEKYKKKGKKKAEKKSRKGVPGKDYAAADEKYYQNLQKKMVREMSTPGISSALQRKNKIGNSKAPKIRAQAPKLKRGR